MLISIKIARNSAFSGSYEPRMLFFLLIKFNWHLNIYKQEKIHAQELSMKKIVTSGRKFTRVSLLRK